MAVGVIGAGITGLALTHHLAERGVDVVTLEAREAAGGVIQSRTVAGQTAEIGPQRMRATPGLRELASVAGVEEDIVTAEDGPLFVYADGELREGPTSVDAFLRTDLLSWPQKLRLLAEPLTRPGMDQETVADLFSRKFGRGAYERFIGPLYGGLYGSDPAEMPAAFALEGLMRREAETGSMLSAFRQRVGQGEKSPPASFPDGIQVLPRALAERYDDRVHLGEPATAIDQRADGRGYTVETPTDSYDVDDVVVTTPADVTADLLDGLAESVNGLGDLTYNPLALVYVESATPPAESALGYQVSYQEDLHTLGVSFNGVMFDRDNLCTVFLGGMHEPEILDESDDRLGELATREFARATGCDAEMLDIERRERWFPAYDQTWWALEDLETPDGVHLATNYTARMGIPSRIREAKGLAEQLAEGADDRGGS
jgi:oxygen-dependent protoporphyrinogen oxidase